MLDTSALAAAMRGSAWLYPIVEIVHIVGFSVLLGSVAMFDLRVLGFGRSVAVLAAARMLLPWSVVSLFLIVPARLLLFSAHPGELSLNKVFQLKLLLIALAGLNALSFHLGCIVQREGGPRRRRRWRGCMPQYRWGCGLA